MSELNGSLSQSAVESLLGLKKADEERYFKALSGSFFRSADAEDVFSLIALLAAEPELAARLPARANHSPAHWASASPILTPVLRVLLSLGASPLGHVLEGGALSPIEGCWQTPLQWAISSGNEEAIQALSEHGALATPEDLQRACLCGQGACALALLEAYGEQALRPFDPLPRPRGFCGPPLSALDAIELALTDHYNPLSERRRKILLAKSRLESLYLNSRINAATRDERSGGNSGRL